MSKYYKAEDVVNKIATQMRFEVVLDSDDAPTDIDAYIPGATAFLIDLLTIDIVRCKECKHGEYRKDFDDYLCDQLGLGVVNDADFFCSDGERIDNE